MLTWDELNLTALIWDEQFSVILRLRAEVGKRPLGRSKWTLLLNRWFKNISVYTQQNASYHLLRASIQQTLCSCVNFLCWINISFCPKTAGSSGRGAATENLWAKDKKLSWWMFHAPKAMARFRLKGALWSFFIPRQGFLFTSFHYVPVPLDLVSWCVCYQLSFMFCVCCFLTHRLIFL